jgi:branched-chain amino acid transport system ATP-binding protein
MAARSRLFNEVLLSVENISLSFGGVKALTDISFDIMKGEIRAIIGPNGAGKSSMLNCINGFYHPQQGAITYKGVKRSRMRPHEAAEQGIARTFQNIALFRGMSTLDNIMTGRNLRMKTGPVLAGAASRSRAARGDRASQGRSSASSTSSRSSTSARRRSASCPTACRSGSSSAGAWPPSPSCLLLDEPMAGMNLEEKQDMCRFVLDVNDEFGTTICLIEHDMGVVMDISDRVVVLDYGKKIGDGVPDVVKNDQRVIDATWE